MSADRMRILFFGTGDIARPAFTSLAADPAVELIGLVTQPDRPAGRHMVPTAPAIKGDALTAGCPVFQPENAGEAADDLAALAPDAVVVMAYGQFLSRPLREMARDFCWNLHASLLPRHRGASPVQAAILHGDAQSGITVMEVTREMDAGDVICSESLTLAADETGRSLHDRLAGLAPVALARALELWRAGRAVPVPQDAAQASWAAKLARADGELDATHAARDLDRRIRAFHPWPGTYLNLPDGSHLKVFPPVRVGPVTSAPPGTLFAVDGTLGLATGCGGSLIIDRVQPAGRRVMTAADYLRGHDLGK